MPVLVLSGPVVMLMIQFSLLVDASNTVSDI